LLSELVEKKYPGYKHTPSLTLEPTDVVPAINYGNLIKVLSSNESKMLDDYSFYFEGMTKFLDGSMEPDMRVLLTSWPRSGNS